MFGLGAIGIVPDEMEMIKSELVKKKSTLLVRAYVPDGCGTNKDDLW